MIPQVYGGWWSQHFTDTVTQATQLLVMLRLHLSDTMCFILFMLSL